MIAADNNEFIKQTQLSFCCSSTIAAAVPTAIARVRLNVRSLKRDGLSDIQQGVVQLHTQHASRISGLFISRQYCDRCNDPSDCKRRNCIAARECIVNFPFE